MAARQLQLVEQRCKIIGEQGKLFFNRGKNNWIVKTSNQIDGFDWPGETVPRATGQNNYREWLDAIEGKVDQGQSNFGLAGPMTETILLGVLAQRNPDTKLAWDAEKMAIASRPDLAKQIKRDYRQGWAAPVG